MRRSKTVMAASVLAILGALATAPSASAVTSSRLDPQPKQAGVLIKPRVAPWMCLDVAHANDGDGALVALWGCNGLPAQRWNLVGETIRSDLPSQRCLEVRAGNAGTGTAISTLTCDSTTRQRWRREGDRIVSVLNGMCLSVLENNFGYGGAVVNWPCNGGDGQKWEPF